MGEWKKAGDGNGSISIDDGYFSRFKEDVLLRLGRNKKYYDYVMGLIGDNGDVCIDNSILAIDTFLSFREKHPDVEILTGDEGHVPLLKYDEYTNSLVIVYAYSKAEKERKKGMSMIVVADNKSRASIIDHGSRIMHDVMRIPTMANPCPFLKDAKAVMKKMAMYVSARSMGQGLLIEDAGINGSYLLDFVLYIGACQGRKVGAISSGRTFATLAAKSFDEVANSYLDDARKCDVLCIYDLDSIPTSKNFIESTLIPFLSTRRQQGKITFATCSTTYSSFISSVSSYPATRDKVANLISLLMKNYDESVDQPYL